MFMNGYAMSKFHPISGFKWIHLKQSDLKKYSNNSSKEYFLKGGLEYPKELQDLHNDYLLAPGKIEIKGKILSES